MKLHSRRLRSRMPYLGNRIFPDVILTVPNKKSPEWYCFLRFSGKGLEIRYYSRLSRVVVSSPVPSRLFPRFFLDFSEPQISLVPVPPIRELPSSLVSSHLKRARERRPLLQRHTFWVHIEYYTSPYAIDNNGQVKEDYQCWTSVPPPQQSPPSIPRRKRAGSSWYTTEPVHPELCLSSCDSNRRDTSDRLTRNKIEILTRTDWRTPRPVLEPEIRD